MYCVVCYTQLRCLKIITFEYSKHTRETLVRSWNLAVALASQLRNIRDFVEEFLTTVKASFFLAFIVLPIAKAADWGYYSSAVGKIDFVFAIERSIKACHQTWFAPLVVGYESLLSCCCSCGSLPLADFLEGRELFALAAWSFSKLAIALSSRLLLPGAAALCVSQSSSYFWWAIFNSLDAWRVSSPMKSLPAVVKATTENFCTIISSPFYWQLWL